MARCQGASGIHVGTMGYGKMEGEIDDRVIAFMIERDSADGPFSHQEWQGMKPTTPIISGGMNALRLPACPPKVVHSTRGVKFKPVLTAVKLVESNGAARAAKMLSDLL